MTERFGTLETEGRAAALSGPRPAVDRGDRPLPVVIVFLLLRKHLMRGTTAGAVKG